MKHASLVLTAILFLSSPIQAQEKPVVLDVWPGKVPGETGKIGRRKVPGAQAGGKEPVKRHHQRQQADASPSIGPRRTRTPGPRW